MQSDLLAMSNLADLPCIGGKIDVTL